MKCIQDLLHHFLHLLFCVILSPIYPVFASISLNSLSLDPHLFKFRIIITMLYNYISLLFNIKIILSGKYLQFNIFPHVFLGLYVFVGRRTYLPKARKCTHELDQLLVHCDCLHGLSTRFPKCYFIIIVIMMTSNRTRGINYYNLIGRTLRWQRSNRNRVYSQRHRCLSERTEHSIVKLVHNTTLITLR